MKRNVCFIGCVNLKENLYDGQTLKTRLVYKQLKEKTNWKIFLVDTYYKKYRFYMFFRSLIGLLFCNNVIVLLSKNGRSFYFKLFSFIMHFKKLNIYHDVIGGYFSMSLKEYPKQINIVKKFKYNLVETKKMVNELKLVGVSNSLYFPNFRGGKPIDNVRYLDKDYKDFVIFSRIMKEKGITLAIETLSKFQNVTLDIYGPVDPSYKEEFEMLLKHNKFVKFHEPINREDASQILSDKYALLFPTYHIGEGFAGTILDSFFNGLPIIASNHGSNAEIVEHGKTGLIFDINDPDGLYNAIDYAINNPAKLFEMRKACLNEADKYTLDSYIPRLINLIETN